MPVISAPRSKGKRMKTLETPWAILRVPVQNFQGIAHGEHLLRKYMILGFFSSTRKDSFQWKEKKE